MRVRYRSAIGDRRIGDSIGPGVRDDLRVQQPEPGLVLGMPPADLGTGESAAAVGAGVEDTLVIVPVSGRGLGCPGLELLCPCVSAFRETRSLEGAFRAIRSPLMTKVTASKSLSIVVPHARGPSAPKSLMPEFPPSRSPS